MKYTLTLFMMMILAVSAKSQWWFDAGVKGAYGPTMMYDQNVFDHGSYKHKLSTGTSFGGRLGFNYGYHVGLSLEYTSSTSNQEFNYESDLYNSFKWKHNDISTLFRYSGNGAYVEVGAKFSNITEVELENIPNSTVTDVTENFSDNYVSGILGFGSYLAGNDIWSLNLGIRMHWAFDDMVSETGKENNYPIVIDELDDPTRKTIATAAQLQAEFNVAFGRFAKTACSDRWRLLLFQ